MWKILALAALCPLVPAQSVSAGLVALDAIAARIVDTSTNTVVMQQAHPAGPLTNTAQQVPHAFWSCGLTTFGSGVRLVASSSASVHPNPPLESRTHADLVLTVTGAGAAFAGIEVTLTHSGDGASSSGFSVDLGNDGTAEIDTGPFGSPTHHRLWTWDFASGPLAIRIRTDQVGAFGTQAYSLTLAAFPWHARARPVAADCNLLGSVTDLQGFRRESTNYQLAVVGTPAFASISVLGLGDFQAFLLSGSGNVVTLVPPAPFLPRPVPLLDSIAFLTFGPSSAATTISGAVLPRRWHLTIPPLPPGLQLYFQHVSAVMQSPQHLGTTNVVRFDT